jgi:large subunit ribosomal protein LX
MKAFKVKGSFMMGDRLQSFKKEIAGIDEDNAKERIYSILGSKHNVKRNKIKIESIVEVPSEAIEDPLVRHKVGEMNG